MNLCSHIVLHTEAEALTLHSMAADEMETQVRGASVLYCEFVPHNWVVENKAKANSMIS